MPAPFSQAQALRAPIAFQTMIPRTAGDRSHEDTSTDGGLARRWVLLSAESRPPQAQRPGDQP